MEKNSEKKAAGLCN